MLKGMLQNADILTDESFYPLVVAIFRKRAVQALKNCIAETASNGISKRVVVNFMDGRNEAAFEE